MRAVQGGIRRLQGLPKEELMTEAKNLGAPYDLVCAVAAVGRAAAANAASAAVQSRRVERDRGRVLTIVSEACADQEKLKTTLTWTIWPCRT